MGGGGVQDQLSQKCVNCWDKFGRSKIIGGGGGRGRATPPFILQIV